jgi:hypothetical protein
VTQTERAPDVVGDLAESCVRYVEAAVGVKLDYTQETLPVLDHYVRLVPEAAGEQVLGLLAPMIGAYYGEVVRRHLPGARWHAPADAYQEWRIEFAGCFLHFNPIGIALEAVLRQEAEGYGAHLAMLDRDKGAVIAAIDVLGEVEEDDYYRLAVRFEVLQTAYEVLMSDRESRERTLGPEVYEADVAKPTGSLN